MEIYEVTMLNKYVKIGVIVSVFVAMTIQASEEIQLYSEAKYPYKNLIHKAKSVNIFFTEKGEGVTCRVNVRLESQEKTTGKIHTSKKRFEQAPLTSCLTRDQAKKILTLAYL